jgi:hypothetical protein
MSTLASVGDLQTFTGLTVDANRAQLLLDIIEADAASIVSPLPAGAKGVILTAAARALPNPSGASSQSMGGSSASWAPGGLYLTRSERNTLRRLAGGGSGAFSVNVAPKAGKDYRDPLGPLTSDDAEQLMYDYNIPGRPA